MLLSWLLLSRSGALRARLRHGFFEVVHLLDATVIGLDGSLQGNRSFTHGFVRG
jgi:hypothetical protein